MDTRNKVLETLYTAIEDFNRQMPPEQRLEKSTDAPLYGRDAPLDSLSLVNLIVASERRIRENFGVGITLADEHAMSQKRSPFRSVGALADFICRRLPESVHAE